MANPFAGAPMIPQDNPELPVIMRRQRMAEQLLQQSQEPLQGQMVSGHYVAPSWTQGLAKVMQSYMGRKGVEEADQRMVELAKQLRGQEQADIQKFSQLAQGTPARTIQPLTPTDDEGNPMPAAEVAGQAPNLGAAYAALLSSQSPALRQMGMQGTLQMPQIQAQKEERDLARKQRMEEIQMRLADARTAAADRAQLQRELAQMQIEARKELATIAKSAANQQPYFQPVQTAQGVMAFNARTGRMEPVQVGGAPVVGAQFDPNLQGTLAGAKESGKMMGEAQTQAKIDLPKVVAQGEETVKLVDDLLKSPGFKQAVGTSRVLGIQNIPGTAAKDFDIRLDQLKGKQFLQAFESLKGGGQITEVEGRKATDAISRMNAAASEEEFTKAAREFQDIIRQGVERAKGRAGGVSGGAPKRMRFDAQGNLIP